MLKSVNYFAFRAVLPPECRLNGPALLFHRGLGVVVHPAVTLGVGVHIAHGATITTSDWDATDERVRICDGVSIGMGAVVNGKRGQVTVLGTRSKVGANAVVVDSVPAGAVVLAPLGVTLEARRTPPENSITPAEPRGDTGEL